MEGTKETSIESKEKEKIIVPKGKHAFDCGGIL